MTAERALISTTTQASHAANVGNDGADAPWRWIEYSPSIRTCDTSKQYTSSPSVANGTRSFVDSSATYTAPLAYSISAGDSTMIVRSPSWISRREHSRNSSA